MCCSAIARTLFFVLAVVGTLLTLGSLLTPSWRNFKVGKGIQEVRDGDYSFGLLTRHCGVHKNRTKDYYKQCIEAFDKKATWEKAAMACIGLSVVCGGLTVAWSCVFCFACCCRSCLAPPLPVFTGLAAVLLAIGTAIYGVKSHQQFDVSKMPDFDTISEFGYSMWLAIGGIAADVLATVFGIIIVSTYDDVFK